MVVEFVSVGYDVEERPTSRNVSKPLLQLLQLVRKQRDLSLDVYEALPRAHVSIFIWARRHVSAFSNLVKFRAPTGH